MRDIFDETARTGETGIILNLDQEKGFDRVNYNFLENVLTTLRFRRILHSLDQTSLRRRSFHDIIHVSLDPSTFVQHGPGALSPSRFYDTSLRALKDFLPSGLALTSTKLCYQVFVSQTAEMPHEFKTDGRNLSAMISIGKISGSSSATRAARTKKMIFCG